METLRKPYPSDVSDEEWALVAPYLTLLSEDAGQRAHSLMWTIPCDLAAVMPNVADRQWIKKPMGWSLEAVMDLEWSNHQVPGHGNSSQTLSV